MNSMMKEQEEQELKSEEVYADANLFIYATLDEGHIGDNARKIINSIKEGRYKAYTAILTIDELLWKVQKALGRESAAQVARDFLRLVHLQFISVDLEAITLAIENYGNHKLDPRDAIHLACMNIKKLNKILSSDPDFDKVGWVKRIDFSKQT